MKKELKQVLICGLVLAIFLAVFHQLTQHYPELGKKKSDDISGATTLERATLDAVASEQDTYYRKYGRYRQVLKERGNPTYETKSLEEDQFDASSLPDNAEVHIYNSPKGKGYRVILDTDNSIIIKHYGAELDECEVQVQGCETVSAKYDNAIRL